MVNFSGIEGEISDMDTVDGHWWVDSKPSYNCQPVEQTLVQKNGFRQTDFQINDENHIKSYTERYQQR